MPDLPALNPGTDSDRITLTVAEAIALATYVNRVTEVAAALAGCNYVHWVEKVVDAGPAVTKIGDGRASDLYARQRAIVHRWSPDTTVTFTPCGEFNAYYLPGLDVVHICTETETNPGAGLFTAAHEAGHAVLHNLGLHDSEDNADTVGAWILLRDGDEGKNALVDAAMWFATTAPEPPEDDDHSSGAVRSRKLLCAEVGGEGRTAFSDCNADYQHVRDWLLEIPDEDPPEVTTDAQ